MSRLQKYRQLREDQKYLHRVLREEGVSSKDLNVAGEGPLGKLLDLIGLNDGIGDFDVDAFNERIGHM